MDEYKDNDLREEEKFNPNQDLGQNLGKNQKIAVGVLAVSAFLIIILWTMQLKNSINGPFTYNPGNSSQTDSASSDANNAEALKTKDTDGDGLTDWDELSIYQTSPYLEDSDSDGVIDKDEINKGTDPNCPEGRTCSSSADITDTSGVNNINAGAVIGEDTTSSNPVAPSGLNLDVNNTTGSPSPTQEDIQKTLSGQSDASTLRKMLLDSGVTAEDLSQISDEDLMASYNEVLGSQ